LQLFTKYFSATAKTVEKCEYTQQGKFSLNFFLFLPETCEIKPLEGRYGEFTIEKMGKSLDMDGTHGDKKRKYNPPVYRISKDGSDEVTYQYFSVIYANKRH
jgi:hypothetical protein